MGTMDIEVFYFLIVFPLFWLFLSGISNYFVFPFRVGAIQRKLYECHCSSFSKCKSTNWKNCNTGHGKEDCNQAHMKFFACNYLRNKNKVFYLSLPCSTFFFVFYKQHNFWAGMSVFVSTIVVLFLLIAVLYKMTMDYSDDHIEVKIQHDDMGRLPIGNTFLTNKPECIIEFISFFIFYAIMSGFTIVLIEEFKLFSYRNALMFFWIPLIIYFPIYFIRLQQFRVRGTTDD